MKTEITKQDLRKMTRRAVREQQLKQGAGDGRFRARIVPNKKAQKDKTSCRKFAWA